MSDVDASASSENISATSYPELIRAFVRVCALSPRQFLYVVLKLHIRNALPKIAVLGKRKRHLLIFSVAWQSPSSRFFVGDGALVPEFHAAGDATEGRPGLPGTPTCREPRTSTAED